MVACCVPAGRGLSRGVWRVAGGWWLAAGGWWLVADGQRLMPDGVEHGAVQRAGGALPRGRAWTGAVGAGGAWHSGRCDGEAAAHRYTAGGVEQLPVP